MAVEHDENLLLTIAVDASQCDIDVVVTVDDVHSRHVGSEHFLKVLASTVTYHILCDKGCGHRHLSERLGMTRCCSDLCR